VETLATLLIGLFGGLGGVLIWEGLLKPRRTRRQLAAILSVEVQANLRKLRAFLQYSEADPLAVLTTLGAYHTVNHVVTRELPELTGSVPMQAVEFYGGLAHFEDLLRTVDHVSDQMASNPGSARSNEEKRASLIVDGRHIAEHLIVEGKRLLVALRQQASLPRSDGEDPLERSRDHLTERITAYAERRERMKRS
jgi:hypothetical protein